ncbi:MAG: L-histidine N(alpha)-methyltransferase [Melioribacteraceae bacterium]|jgi:L-histidine N-alpha-methyltransferase|nr:L-histidine N(alpha)-methyltransferase [Melioribacteraceae bacterium]
MNYTEQTINTDVVTNLENHLPQLGIEKVEDEILKGLKENPKYISPKFFYDPRGSELFEEITELDEYYPTRTEKSIIQTIGQKLDLDFSNMSIIELGSGDASKIRLLISQIPENDLAGIKYYPIDISQSAIEKSSEILAEEFPSIVINGIVADYIHQKSWVPESGNRLFCFFGSTIGNMNISEIEEFLKLIGSEMESGDCLLLGMDMVKDIEVLEKAYNDSKYITAKFNLNILNVVNNLVGTNFNSADFEHLAFYDREKERIEMHLKAKNDMIITSNSGKDGIYIKTGETIHTENSHKFSEESISKFGSWAGLNVEKILTDDNHWFSLVHYRK